MTLMPDIDVLLPDEETVRSRRDALVDELRRGARGARPVRSARRLALVLAALLTVAGGAAAAGLFSADDVNVQAGVGCYDRASLRTDAALPTDTALVGPVTDPVAACAALWREGVVDGRSHSEAPPLVACTGKDQPVRVLPGDGPDTCSELGLVPLPDDYSQAALRTDAGTETVP